MCSTRRFVVGYCETGCAIGNRPNLLTRVCKAGNRILLGYLPIPVFWQRTMRHGRRDNFVEASTWKVRVLMGSSL